MQEINNESPGAMLLVGRDPGAQEMRSGRPFVGPAGHLLDNLLGEAGIRREKINITNLVHTQPAGNDFWRHPRRDVERGRAQLLNLVRRLRPSIVVTLGNESSYELIEDWPSKSGNSTGSFGIQERRGYLWAPKRDIRGTNKILSTLHPAGCLVNRDPSGISEMLLLRDLKRARQEALSVDLRRVECNVEVVGLSKARGVLNRILEHKMVACDIETHGPDVTACVGFATSATQAYVFTPKTMRYAYEILADDRVGKIFQNGQFDLYHLLSRDDIYVFGRIDDTMVGWHCLWPEIAAQRENRKGVRRTHKSLAFLESIYGESPEWWKDYDFKDNMEMYQLNGKDVCKTYHIWAGPNCISDNLNREGVRRIYEHERRMIWPCVMIQNRGMLVDEKNKKIAVESLNNERAELAVDIKKLIQPFIMDNQDRLENRKLFFRQVTCKCCRNGRGKVKACWSCAGFDAAPSKAMLVEKCKEFEQGELEKDIRTRLIDYKKTTKDSLANIVLHKCKVCNGLGSWEEFEFNPSSPAQIQEIIYNLLKLPVRYEKGNPTANEFALKSLLGGLG